MDQFEYQKYNTYFAQVAGKMEELCRDELIELKAENVKPAYRGVYFSADKETLYSIVYMSRLITKVFAPLLTFSCHSDKYLKKTALNIPWDKLFKLENTFAIDATVANSNIKHSKYAALCLKDSIADYFREKFGSRPSVDTKDPDISFNLHIDKNKAVISLNISGDSLHKRGYRTYAGEAPMQETLAAALIRVSGWNGEKPLIDLMCGSATILCEALMHYSKIPAQYLRDKFGFFNMPDYDKSLWFEVKKRLDKEIRPLPPGLITGYDKSNDAIGMAKKNLRNLPSFENINLICSSFEKIDSAFNAVIITNPPYGIRLENKEIVSALYKKMGDFLKQNCKGSCAYIYVGDLTLVKSIGLKPQKRFPLVNGAIEGELVKIEVY